MTTVAKLMQAGTWQACVQALHAHVQQAAQGHCLVWVNPAQTDVFADNASAQAQRMHVPIVHPRFDVQFAPYLVALDLSASADCDVLQQSVQTAYEAWDMPSLQACAGQAIGGWIICNSSPQKLASYWASQIHLHTVGGLTKLLRFHDPSVREWLWPALTAQQQTQLLGPAQALIGINRQQRVMVHTPPSPLEPANHAKLQLISQQWADVEDYAAVHAAWLAQAGLEPAQWRHQLPVNWQLSIFKALQKATQHGVTDEHDRALFAQHALQLGPDFHSHSILKNVWLKTREGNFYGGAIEAVTGQPAAQLQKYLNAHTS